MSESFPPYTQWEDWRAGMYRDCTAEEKCVLSDVAVQLLANRLALLSAMRDVIVAWPIVARINLADKPNNRSWLGQAACCHSRGVPEEATRNAWGNLTERQQLDANAAADQAIDEWRSRTVVDRQRRIAFGD